jgi:hypothetical protein
VSGLTFTDAFYGALLAAIIGGAVALIVGLLTASAMRTQALISFKATSRMQWISELRTAVARLVGISIALKQMGANLPHKDVDGDPFLEPLLIEFAELHSLVLLYLDANNPAERRLRRAVKALGDDTAAFRDSAGAKPPQAVRRVIAAAKAVFCEHARLAREGE